MPESTLAIGVSKQSPSYHTVRIGEERFSLTSDEVNRLQRRLSAYNTSTGEKQRDSPLENSGIDISADTGNLSVETEYQMLLLIERFSEIDSIGEVRSTQIVELIIRHGLSDISRSHLEDLRWNSDAIEKAWLYLLGLRDRINSEFNN